MFQLLTLIKRTIKVLILKQYNLRVPKSYLKSFSAEPIEYIACFLVLMGLNACYTAL